MINHKTKKYKFFIFNKITTQAMIIPQRSCLCKYRSRLQAYRTLRNALVHIPYDGDEPEPIAGAFGTI